MNLMQAVRAIRALEKNIESLQGQVDALTKIVQAPKEKRPYNRKTPNAENAPESLCPSSPMEN